MSNVFTRTLGAFTAAWRAATTNQRQSIAKGAGSHQVTAALLMQASRSGALGGNGDLNYFMRLAVTNPWWFSANRTIANRISDTAQFRVEQKQKGEWVDAQAHEFLTILERPNSMMTGGMLLGATAEWMNAAGNGYWFAVTDTPGVGPIRELWPLPADKVEPDPMRLRISPFTGRTVIDYRYTLGGITWLPGENVIHFRASNLFDYWRGAAPLSALQSILPTDLAQTNWLGSFFGENNAVPTAVISLPPETSDTDFDIIKRDIVEQFGAQRRAAITRAGDMSVEAIQQTIDEMQVIQGMEFNAKAIRAVLGVPKMDELASGQSRLAAEMGLMRDAVQPMLNLFAQWMTLKLMPFYEERPGTLRVVAEDVVPQDSAIAVAEYGAYGLDRTLNENRKEQKLEPLKLKGPLAPMQPLFDQVPQRYVEMFAPILQQAAQAAQRPTAGMLGQGGDDAALVAQMSGQRSLSGLVGGDENKLVAAMAGQNAPKQQPKQLGVRSAGIKQPEDLVAAMAGGALKAMKGSDESGYYDPHYGRPGEQGGSTSRDDYRQEKKEGRAWTPKRRNRTESPTSAKDDGGKDSDVPKSLDACKTIADLEGYAKSKFPRIKWEFDGADPDAIRPTVAQFEKLAADWPDVAQKFRYIGTYAKDIPYPSFSGGFDNERAHFNFYESIGDDAETTDVFLIALNPKEYGDRQKFETEKKFYVEKGWHPPGCDVVESTMTHEFGHAVNKFLLDQTNTSFLDAVGSDGTGLVWDTVTNFTGAKPKRGELSDYALTDNGTLYSEAWAEAFASMYHTPDKKKSSYVRRMESILNEMGKPSEWKRHKKNEFPRLAKDITDPDEKKSVLEKINKIRFLYREDN